MTARIQIALLAAAAGSVIAIVNATTREVLAVQSGTTGPIELDLHAGACPLAVEVTADLVSIGGAIVIGQPLPEGDIPESLRAILMPSPMAMAQFVGQAPSLGASVLLEDVATVFKFGFGDQVRLGTSAIVGTVDGRSDYRNGDTRYFIKFNDKDGLPQGDWYDEEALSHVGEADEEEEAAKT